MSDFFRNNKNTIFYFILFFILLAFIELLAYLSCTFFFEKTYMSYAGKDFDRIARTISPQEIKNRIERGWTEAESILGWSYAPDSRGTGTNEKNEQWNWSTDELGSRTNPYDGKGREVIISTYGDSHTFGSEVNDDETWQYYLSKTTDSKVLNFGNGGYGTDQALLKLIYNTEKGIDRARIRMLCIYSMNIDRIMSRNRFFYSGRENDVFNFKPMFHMTDNEFTLLEIPFNRMRTSDDLWQVYEETKQNDLWYQLVNKNFALEFPYTLSVLKLATYVFKKKTLEKEVDFSRTSLYEVELATRKMHYIIDRYISFARQNDFLPVVLFMPSFRDLQNLMRGKEVSYKRFLESLKNELGDEDDLIIMDVFDYRARYDITLFNILPFKGHYSAYGNNVVAEAVFSKISHLLNDTNPPR